MTATTQWETAYLFPGQGSQFPGMARELGRCHDGARELVEQAEAETGLPVLDYMRGAEASALADPEVAQVMVFVLSLALYDEFSRRGAQPCVVAGHSLGEYTALVACGSLDRSLGLRLVSARGKAMAAAAREQEGTMAAVVGLEAEKVEALCDETASELGCVVLANLNSPRQTVVSGAVEAVEYVLDRARDAGALRARRLPVGGAYHSPLMAAAEERMSALLAAAPLEPPRIPLVSSVTASVVTDVEAYRDDLLCQVSRPVRWQALVSFLAGAGVETFVEVGPGRVLTGLSREMARHATCQPTAQALRAVSNGTSSDDSEGV